MYFFYLISFECTMGKQRSMHCTHACLEGDLLSAILTRTKIYMLLPPEILQDVDATVVSAVPCASLTSLFRAS